MQAKEKTQKNKISEAAGESYEHTEQAELPGIEEKPPAASSSQAGC